MRNWEEAQEVCKSDGAQLAIVNNLLTHNAVKDLTNKGQAYWLGAIVNGPIPSDWYWIDGKGKKEMYDVSRYKEWRSDEPKGKGYLVMHQHEWIVDTNHTNTKYFVCQIRQKDGKFMLHE